MSHIPGLPVCLTKQSPQNRPEQSIKLCFQNPIISVNIYCYYTFIPKDKFCQENFSTLNY